MAAVLTGCGDDTQPTVDAATPDAAARDAPADAATDAAIIDANPLLMEPYENLPRIFAGAKAYWEQLPAGSPKHFPPPAGPVEAATCCRMPQGYCVPDPSLWTSNTWIEMQFHIDVPFYFQYSFDSAGTDATATFVARAFGDLNCNNVLSTYEIHGSIDADGGVTGGVITAINPNE